MTSYALCLRFQVDTERERVQRESDNVKVEADKVAIIEKEVSAKQADTEADLAKAEPAIVAAQSALDSLDKSELGQCKIMSTPPPGVLDVFVACMVSSFKYRRCRASHSLGVPSALRPWRPPSRPPALANMAWRIVRVHFGSDAVLWSNMRTFPREDRYDNQYGYNT